MHVQKKISTIVNAAEILKCLSEDIGKISDISKKLNLNKATVHRTLKTLESTGLSSQDPITRRYYIGPLVQDLASNPVNGHQILYFTAHEHLKYLRDISGETVGLQVRFGVKRLVIDEVESPQAIKFAGGKGKIGPIHAGASGKVLLSQTNEKDLGLLLNRIELLPVGPNTITDRASLLKELEKIRRQGYATSFSEYGINAAVIAVPITGYFSSVALGIVGPGERFLDKRMNFLEPLIKSATQISEKLNQASTDK